MTLGLRGRMVSGLGATLAVLLAGLIGFQAWNTARYAARAAHSRVEETAQRFAEQLNTQLTEALMGARFVAQTFEGLKAAWVEDRSLYNSVLSQVLNANTNYCSIWTGWEPDALDGKDKQFVDKSGHDSTGRFVPLWYRGPADVELALLTDYVTPGKTSSYEVVKAKEQECLLEPQAVKLGDQTLPVLTMAVPVRYGGAFVGVVGVQLPITHVQALIGQIKPFEVGSARLVSSEGRYVAHADPARIGTRVSADDADGLKALGGGRVFSRVAKGAGGAGGGSLSEVFVPVKAVGDGHPWVLAVSVPTVRIQAESRQAMFYTIGLGIAAFVVMIAVVMWIAHTITTPLRGALRFVEELARENLEARIDTKSSDEVGQITQALNQMMLRWHRIVQVVENVAQGDLRLKLEPSPGTALGPISGTVNRMVDGLETTIRSIHHSSTALSGASLELKQVSSLVKTSSEQTTTQSGRVATSADGVGRSIQSVATAAEEMNSTIQDIARNAEHAASVSRHAAELAARANGTMAKLGDSSTQIGRVVGLITSIASQTNLLALNATIEAARAGEAGKGFAVVANEVKALAERTTKATQEIVSQTEAIRSDATAAISAVQEIGGIIAQISESQSAIAHAVDEQGQTTQEISTNASVAAQDGSKIARGIAGVADGARTCLDGATNAAGAAAKLEDMSAQLRALVGAFKLDDRNEGPKSEPPPVTLVHRGRGGLPDEASRCVEVAG